MSDEEHSERDMTSYDFTRTVASLRSKRFREVGNKEWDFRFFARAKNGTRGRGRKETPSSPIFPVFGSRPNFSSGCLLKLRTSWSQT